MPQIISALQCRGPAKRPNERGPLAGRVQGELAADIQYGRVMASVLPNVHSHQPKKLQKYFGNALVMGRDGSLSILNSDAQEQKTSYRSSDCIRVGELHSSHEQQAAAPCPIVFSTTGRTSATGVSEAKLCLNALIP
jgi:hypothetical protein